MTTPYTTPGPLAQQYRISRGQRSRAAGWRMPVNNVYCGRPSLWGNPYTVAESGGPEDACRLYHNDMVDCPDVHDALIAPLVTRWQQHRSLVLLCWCAPDAPCHCVPLADALAQELERQGVAP